MIILRINEAQYAQMVKEFSPPSPLARDMVKAFLVGGAICVLGQLVLNGYRALGLEEDAASTAEAVTMVFFGALLTGLGVYDKLARHAGAGTLVPITGFANAVASPAMEFRREGLVTGMAAKIFGIAGPVLVFGVGASVVYGVIYYVMLRLL